jgi:hypothetical protein
MAHYKDIENSDELYWLDEGQGIDLIPKSCVEISDSAAETIRANKLKVVNDARPWNEKRQVGYGGMAEQLDEIYHNGIDSWKAKIKAVKDKHPKGTK